MKEIVKQELEFKGFKMSGFIMLFLHIIGLPALIAATIALFNAEEVIIPVCIILFLIWLISMFGYMQLEPNEARVMVFFGKYSGTFTQTGFHWVNPFYAKKKLSMRARNLDVAPIKVNDKGGNPIMVGLVLVWKLKDTYKAMFEIDSQTMASNVATGVTTVSSIMKAFEKELKKNDLTHILLILENFYNKFSKHIKKRNKFSHEGLLSYNSLDNFHLTYICTNLLVINESKNQQYISL